MSRPRTGRSVRSAPPKTTRPESARSRPAMLRSKVVLPAALGPSTTKNSPALMARSMPSRAATEPKVLRKPATTRSDIDQTGSAAGRTASVSRAGMASSRGRPIEAVGRRVGAVAFAARPSMSSVTRPAVPPLPARRLGKGGARQEDLLHRRRLDAAQLLHRRRQEVVEIAEDDRRLVEQQTLDLARRRALRPEVEGADILRDQLVVLGVLEMRRIPGAVALQRRRQEHVGHAAMTVVGDAERRI